jgi:hypothetical protein
MFIDVGADVNVVTRLEYTLSRLEEFEVVTTYPFKAFEMAEPIRASFSAYVNS